MYYNGEYSWFSGDSTDPSTPSSSHAGTGLGVVVGVVDSGINPEEATTGSSISINTALSYDYTTNTAGSGNDTNGHGTHVAGIIAAPRNDSGMHGVAYNSTLVNFRIFGSSRSAFITDGMLADIFNRSTANQIQILNNSWGSIEPVTGYTLSQVQTMLPTALNAANSYLSGGGVVVFATGNDSRSEPSLQAGLPYLVAGLERGWLAVMAVGSDGVRASYSNLCGVAAHWCLAAPGTNVYSMSNTSDYLTLSGTSMSAPHVSGALAGLKSMFPNLSYQQVRDRLFVSANKAGVYADTATYGQGLMDLEAASSPIGGLSLPTSTSASGPVSVSGGVISLPQSALSSLNLQSGVLMLDNYQRAPFLISSRAFVSPLLNERSLEGLLKAVTNSTYESSSSNGLMTAAFSEGDSYDFLAHGHSFKTGISFGLGIKSLAKSLGIDWFPYLSQSNTATTSLAYAHSIGKATVSGLMSWPDKSKLLLGNGLREGIDFSAKQSTTVVGQYQFTQNSKIGVSFSFARNAEKPIGTLVTGAFKSNPKLSSYGLHASHRLANDSLVRLSFEQTQLQKINAPLLSFADQTLNSVKLSTHTQLSRGSSIELQFSRTVAAKNEASFSLPLTIDERGAIGMVKYTLDTGSLFNSNFIGVTYKTKISPRWQWTTLFKARESGSSSLSSQIATGLTATW